MTEYRDELNAARHRIETLQANVEERDAALRAREAEIAEQQAVIERLGRGELSRGARASAPTRATLVAAGVVALGAIGWAQVRGARDRAQFEARLEVLQARSVEDHDAREVAVRERLELTRELEKMRAELEAMRQSQTAIPFEASRTGTLNLNSIPRAEVFLDHKPIGHTPQVGVTVTAGNHEIVFIHPEKGKKSVFVTVGAGATATAAVKFP